MIRSDIFIKFPNSFENIFNNQVQNYRLFGISNSYNGKNVHSDSFVFNQLQKQWFRIDDTKIMTIRQHETQSQNAVFLFYRTQSKILDVD